MNATCAWCGRTIRKSPGPGISHGICPTCARLIRAEMDLAATPSPLDPHPNTPQPAARQISQLAGAHFPRLTASAPAGVTERAEK